MPVVDLYSKRQKSLRGEVPEVFAYRSLPLGLRTQIIHITNDCFPNEGIYVKHGKKYPITLSGNILTGEYGKPDLGYNHSACEDLTGFILSERDVERVLDATELIFKHINTLRNRNGGYGQGSQPQSVSGEMARYALNLTGSNIIFLTGLSGNHQLG